MSLTRVDPALERPIESPEMLVDYFRAGEKPRGEFRVGTEHEKIGLYEETLEPIPYEGERGIGALLGELQRAHDFGPLIDAGTLVGLERDGASITLEPGGQLELSGAPLETLHQTCREFHEHLALMKHVSERFGIVWLGLGIHPLAKVSDLPRMPRERYSIMRDYLGRRDRLGLEMMHATGTVQANLDFESEADCATKFRVAQALQPVVTALYANSSLSEGGPNGFESRRAEVWRHTDPDRCGFLPFVFEPDFGSGTAYAHYTEWALDVPMFFVQRDGRHVPLAGTTFRDYLRSGLDGRPATLYDWNLHLTTLFPEVRLKRVIEVRGADAVPPGGVCALPALWKGLLYDEQALATASRRVEGWTWAGVDRMHQAVARSGLSADGVDAPVLELAREVVALASAGLQRIGARNAVGEDESIFLEPLVEVVERGTSPGRQLLERFRGAFSERIEQLVEYAKY